MNRSSPSELGVTRRDLKPRFLLLMSVYVNNRLHYFSKQPFGESQRFRSPLMARFRDNSFYGNSLQNSCHCQSTFHLSMFGNRCGYFNVSLTAVSKKILLVWIYLFLSITVIGDCFGIRILHRNSAQIVTISIYCTIGTNGISKMLKNHV